MHLSAGMQFNRDVQNLIANLRGVPEDRGRSRKRDATDLDSLVEVIFERHQIGQDNLENVIMANWKDIVGERTAHRCRPQRLVNNRKLVILAGNPVIRQELQFMQNKILRQLHALPGCQCVREIVVLNG